MRTIYIMSTHKHTMVYCGCYLEICFMWQAYGLSTCISLLWCSVILLVTFMCVGVAKWSCRPLLLKSCTITRYISFSSYSFISHVIVYWWCNISIAFLSPSVHQSLRSYVRLWYWVETIAHRIRILLLPGRDIILIYFESDLHYKILRIILSPGALHTDGVGKFSIFRPIYLGYSMR